MTRPPSRPQSGGQASNPLAGLSNVIQKAKEEETAVLQENERLKKLLTLQEELIKKQRAALLEVTKTAAELAEIEKQRTLLKSRLASQKSQLLVSASEAAQVSSLIDKIIEDSSPPPLSAGKTGELTLSAIEKIQAQTFAVTEQCMKDPNMSVPIDVANQLIFAVNDVVEAVIRSGAAEEPPEDTIKRQSYLISALVPPQEG
jgi:myosin heavy subunit